MTPWRTGSVLVAVALAAATTACGTTVQTRADGSAPGLGAGSAAPGTQGGLGPAPGPVDGAPPGSAGGVNAGAGIVAGPGKGAGQVGGTGPSGEVPGGSGSVPAGSQLRTGRGITRTEIRVGIVIQDDAGAANKAAGLPVVDTGDPARNYQVLIDELNKRGLIAGRKVVLKAFRFNVSGGANVQAIEQEGCEYFTNDEPVFAVLYGGSENLNGCLAKAGILQIGGRPTELDSKAIRQYPSLFLTGAVSIDRYARGLVDGLTRQGFFQGATKVGILTFDQAIFKRVTDDVLVPLVKQQVKGEPDVAYTTYPYTVEQNSDYIAGIQSAMLKFRTEGVTHILTLETSGAMAYFGMKNAESQGYRPKYGLGSPSAFQYSQQNQSDDVKANQLPNVTGVGWVPFDDTADAQFVAPPGWARCQAEYRKGDTTFSTQDAGQVGAAICSEVWLLEQGLRAAGNDLTRDGVTRVLNATGCTFAPPNAYGCGITPARHDTVTTYRTVRWDKAKGVFRYTSGNIAF